MRQGKQGTEACNGIFRSSVISRSGCSVDQASKGGSMPV